MIDDDDFFTLGSLPQWIVSNMTSLTYFSAYNNRLTGNDDDHDAVTELNRND